MLDLAVTLGAETEAARQFAKRFGDVRRAADLLQAAVQQAYAEDIRFDRAPPPAEWVKSLMAATEPLRRILEVCTAFEDALAGAPPGEAGGRSQADIQQILPNDARDVPADIARRATFVVPIASEDKIVDRRMTPGDVAAASIADVSAAARAALPDERTRETIAKVVATAEAARPHIEAVDRAATLVAAVDALGPHAQLAPLSDADLDRAARGLPRGRAGALDEAAIRRLAEAHKQEKDLR